EQDERAEGAERGAEPVRAVDREVGATADTRGQELVDRGVDGGVLAADARARDRAEEDEHPEARRERRQEGRPEIDGERDEEELLPPQLVRQPPEDERAGDGPRE